MALRTTLPAAAAIVATALAGWLYLDNRRLTARVGTLERTAASAAGDPWARSRADGDGGDGDDRFADRGPMPTLWRRPAPPVVAAAPAAQRPLVPVPTEGRMERRVKRTQMIDALLGRDADESEDEYKARILPMMQAALDVPRQRVEDMRHKAEEAAHVSDDQRKQLDEAFAGVYDDLIDYTDTAVADGQLTPYGRNVKGVLQYAGGLGAILEGAEGRIGKILSPDQLRAMSDAGFEWGEYLGLRAPWERLRPPPPRPGS